MIRKDYQMIADKRSLSTGLSLTSLSRVATQRIYAKGVALTMILSSR